MNKREIVIISDLMLSSSGVAVQSRYLASGLAQTGKYQICQLGAAIRHQDYTTRQVAPDIIVKPIDGYGDKFLYRQLLATERPDAVILFTDPRFFMTLFEHHDEFHQICPLVYNTLWDQSEFVPQYNKNMYDTIDMFMCINHPTYKFLTEMYGEKKTRWAPHALPADIFYPISQSDKIKFKRDLLAGRDDHFVFTWVNRNAHRKRPGDVLWAFKMFLDRLQREQGHSKATLMMHTDPYDNEGPNLVHVMDTLGINANVVFSKDVLSFDQMRTLYGVSDTVVNISYAEGFGLGILEAMMCGKPVIAPKTGGLERQVVNHITGEHNGIALDIDCKKLVGSQATPYIVEDIVTVPHVADAFWKMYSMSESERASLGSKAVEYARTEFNMNKLISTWDEALETTITNWRSQRPSWIKKVI